MLSMLLLVAMSQAPQERPIERPGRVAVDPSRTTQLYDVRDLLEPLLALTAGPDDMRERFLSELGYLNAELDAERRRLETRIGRYLNEQDRRPRAPEAFGAVPTLDETFRKERVLRAETQSMAEFLAKFVDPPLRRTQSRLEVAAPGTLSMSGTPEQHAWLDTLLRSQRGGDNKVEVTAHFMTLPAGALASAGITSGAVAESAGDVSALRAKLDGIRKDELTSPKLQMFLLQRSQISVLDQVAYVRDWHIEVVEPGPQRIAVPDIGILQEGYSLTVRAAALEPGLYAVTAEIEKSDVERPIPTSKIQEPQTGTELEVALPEIRKVRIASDLRLRDGAAAVLIQKIDEEHELAVLVEIAGMHATTPEPPQRPHRK